MSICDWRWFGALCAKEIHVKFRQKIWALPLSACLIFGFGLSTSLLIASNSASQLSQLRSADNRVLEVVLQVDRLSEQFDTSIEAAGFGDGKKLSEAEAYGKSMVQRLDAMSQLAGKRAAADALKSAFVVYRDNAVGVVQGMMSGQDFAAKIPERRAAQTKWNSVRKAQLEQAQVSVEAGFNALADALRMSVLTSVFTAVAVVLVLGLASWFVVRSVWRDLGGEPADLRRVAEQIADGQLDTDVHADDASSLAAAVSRMAIRLRETVTVIREVSEGIHVAAAEISDGNQDLSQRTEKAAASLQETTSSMQQLASGARESGMSATQANRLAETATAAASEGGKVVSQVVSSMDAINASSRQITEIIGVIDAIAFQTNILALNAAVEAARAGEQGRGFAVVASEVRTLAKRSAEAASQIKQLIQSSTGKVESGAALVSEAGAAMSRIVQSVQQVSEMINGISQAVAHQTTDIGNVSNAIVQLDSMTQQNSALVEQSAAASLSLQEQTNRLADTVAVFRLKAA